MKLVRFGQPGRERPGLLVWDGIRDLSGVVADIGPEELAAGLITQLRGVDVNQLPLVGGSPRFGPPLRRVGKFLAIGLNYRDHALETGMPTPAEPVLFLKASSCLSGPNDPILRPRGATKLDWEVELGVVIGSAAHHVNPEQALAHVAGYLIVNDVSERAYQFSPGGQWAKGKSCDTFGPIGPWLVTADEVADPQALGLRLQVNGVAKQVGSTADMIFPVAAVISHLSAFMTLQPGDLITTGTPAGVGSTRKPPEYLNPGDVMTLSVDGLGEQTQQVLQE